MSDADLCATKKLVAMMLSSIAGFLCRSLETDQIRLGAETEMLSRLG